MDIEFIDLYETLSSLEESKADTQRLIDFAGENLAKRFEEIKQRLKAPENDLYYWIKNKTPVEFEAFIKEVENTPTNSMHKIKSKEGAELIQETQNWKVYRITTFEAAQLYGRDTQWCITGVNETGPKYWDEYTSRGVEFYFLISKDIDFDPRGTKGKFAVAVTQDGDIEVYNQQDKKVSYAEIPDGDEIRIPGVDLTKAGGEVYYCEDCGALCDEDEMYVGPNGEIMCEDCFAEHCAICEHCGEVVYIEDIVELTGNDEYDFICSLCATELGYDDSDYENDYGDLDYFE